MTARRPAVAIGLPVYNGERYLAQALDSHLGQTFADFELIVSDNASTDGTEAICRAYAQRDGRVRYHRGAINVGGPRNFNRAFELSDASYFKWATADDYWGPEFLAQAHALLEARPEVVLCYPRTTLVDSEGRVLETYEDRLHLDELRPSHRFIRLVDTIGLCNAHLGLIRRAALARTGLIGDYRASDVNLLAELSLYGQFHELPARLFFRRMHPQSSSWDRTNTARQRDYYDPNQRGLVSLHRWRHFGAQFTAVRRAPLGVAEKGRLYRHLARRMVWSRDALRRELRAALRARWARRTASRMGAPALEGQAGGRGR